MNDDSNEQEFDFQNNNHPIQVCKKRYNLKDEDLIDILEMGSPNKSVAERIKLRGKELIIITSNPSEWKKIESEAQKLSIEGQETFERFFFECRSKGKVSPEEYEKRVNELKGEELERFILSQERTWSLQELSEAIEIIRSKESNVNTFAVPSHPLMFSLLALFAGKPEQIPRKLLEKPYNQRTVEEQEEADRYLEQIFETTREIDYSEGRENITEKKVALICNNQKVEGKAEISWSLFRHDVHFREERLALYIKRTFGPEGIRHLLGLIIGLEENFRRGHFEWSVNEHLERLGYRKKNRSYDPELKQMASEIIKIFTGLCITSSKKDGKAGSIQGKFLFMVEGFELQTFEKEIIDERITLAATDFWYKNAFTPSDGQAPQYTKLLKEIVKENHKNHPLTLYLAPLLAIFWRMNPQQKIKVKNLMDWCDLDTEGRYRSRDIRTLESSLAYMKSKGYLGDWKHDGENTELDKNSDPLNVCLTLVPPSWLQREIQLIAKKRETFAVDNKQKEETSLEQFNEALKKSGLTAEQFGQHLGVTGRYVSLIRSGKRNISRKIAQKLKEYQQKKEQKGTSCDPS